MLNHFYEIARLYLRNDKAHIYMDNMSLADAEHEIELLIDYLKENKATLYFIQDAGMIIAILWMFPIVYHGQNRFHIKALSVSEDHVGKGLAHRMLLQMEKDLKSNCIVYTYCDFANKGAICTYKSAGFIEEGMQYVKLIQK